MRALLCGVAAVPKRSSCWLFLTFALLIVGCGVCSEQASAAISPTKTFYAFAGGRGYLLAEDASKTGWDAYPQHGTIWLSGVNGYSRWAYKPAPSAANDWFRTGYSTKLSNSYPYSFTFYPQPPDVQLNLSIVAGRTPAASWTAAASPDPGLTLSKPPSLGTVTDMGTTFRYTVDLTRTPFSPTKKTFTDKFSYYVTDSTIETLPMARSATCVLGKVCDLGGMNRSRLVTVVVTLQDKRVTAPTVSALTYYDRAKAIKKICPDSAWRKRGRGVCRVTIPADKRPNLKPYRPSGWASPLSIRNESGALVTGQASPSDILLIDWAAKNNSAYPANSTFNVALYLDDELHYYWTYESLQSQSNTGIQGYELGRLSPGDHLITMAIDSPNMISESDEADNNYVQAISISDWRQ